MEITHRESKGFLTSQVSLSSVHLPYIEERTLSDFVKRFLESPEPPRFKPHLAACGTERRHKIVAFVITPPALCPKSPKILHRMSKKRKRNEDAEDASSVDGNEDAGDLPVVGEAEGGLKKVLDETETVNVQKKIFHAIKETGRAFKKARDFEIRKIIKRIKASEYCQ